MCMQDSSIKILLHYYLQFLEMIKKKYSEQTCQVNIGLQTCTALCCNALQKNQPAPSISLLTTLVETVELHVVLGVPV